MRRHSSSFALALLAVVTAACDSGAKKSGSGSDPYTGVVGDNYDIAVVKPTGGFVTSDVGGIDCGFIPGLDKASCDAIGVSWATTTTLTAMPAEGYRFVQWAGECGGTEPTCTLVGTGHSYAWFRVVAQFASLDPRIPPEEEVQEGRVHGYVREGANYVSGITVSLRQYGATIASATTAAQGTGSQNGGRYAIDAAPGTYELVLTDPSGTFDADGNVVRAARYTVPPPLTVVVPDPSDGPCAQEPRMVTEGGEGVHGCLVRQDLEVTQNGTYYHPPFAMSASASPRYAAGPSTPVSLTCSNTSGFGSTVRYSWTQSAGPTRADMTGWTATPTFTVPTIEELAAVTAQADSAQEVVYGSTTVSCPKYDGVYEGTQGAGSQVTKVGCGISELYLQNRAGFVTIGRQMYNEAGYSFTCKATRTAGGADLTSVQKAAGDSLVTVVTAVPHGLSSGEIVTVAVSTADASFRKGNFQIDVVDASSFTYSDGLTVTEASTPVAADFRISVSVTASASFNPLNMVNAAYASSVWCDPSGGSCTIRDDRAQVPLRAIVIANAKQAASYAWTFTRPPTSAAVLNLAETRNPWFKGDVAGDYTLTNDGTTIRVRVADWVGASSAAPGACLSCHGGSDVDTEWAASVHNQIIEAGMSGASYSTTCLQCHTQGYDPSVSNGGWDDIARRIDPTTGLYDPVTGVQYNLPDFMFLSDANGNFGRETLPAGLQPLSGIACESCHGPGRGVADNDMHANAASFEATACLWCHDGGHHSIYNQWRSSGHSNLEIAQGEGVGSLSAYCGADKNGNLPAAGTCVQAATNADIGKESGIQGCGFACHSGQGFSRYAVMLKADGMPTGPVPVSNVYERNIAAITCQACHEPHSLELRLGAADAEGLKLGGSSTVVPGASTGPGAAPTGVPSNSNITLNALAGEGALCSACHNSRRAVGLQADGTEGRYSGGATHPGPQTDVYLGLSMFWFDASARPTTNVHSSEWFTNSCADCHVKLIPADYPTVANHTFEAAHSCEVCHGSGMLPDGTPAKGKPFMDETKAQMHAIDDAAEELVLSYLAAGNSLVVRNDADAGTTFRVPTCIPCTGPATATDTGGVPSGCNYPVYFWNGTASVNSDTRTCADVYPGGSSPATIALTGGSVTKLELGDVHGQLAVKLWLGANTTETPDVMSRISNLKSPAGASLVSARSTDPGYPNLFFGKAAWNYILVEADGSEGIHNMLVVRALLTQTLNALQTTPLTAVP
jgi:hypothetical protein